MTEPQALRAALALCRKRVRELEAANKVLAFQKAELLAWVESQRGRITELEKERKR